MSYLVFARKYRPQRFDDLVGQDPVGTTLKNAITQDKIAHAYLFSGPRGVGKTSAARIFARALNCKGGPQAEPCGECRNCVEIKEGRSLDVLEIDGASNRGIDDIRSLRENVKFTPAASKFKIYIIDEAHQITHDAFNALLKTLEEPPPHVIFILATTEPQKIPMTILSRCQRYRFRLIPTELILRRLSRIAQLEGFKVADEAMRMVARFAAGSLRDGLSVMDQVVSFAGNEIRTEDVRYVLGVLPRELVDRFVELLSAGQLKEALEQVKHVAEDGYDLFQFAGDVREYYRKLLITVSGNIPDDESDEQISRLKVLAKKLGVHRIIRDMRVISKCIEEMRWSEHTRLLLELYTARLSEPYVDLRELAAGLDGLPEMGPAGEVREPGKTAGGGFNGSASGPKKAVSSPVAQENPADDSNDEVRRSDDDTRGGAGQPADEEIEAVIREIDRIKPSLGAGLKEGRFTRQGDHTVRFSFPSRYGCEMAERNQQFLENIFKRLWKKPVKITAVFEGKPAEPLPEPAGDQSPAVPAGPIAEEKTAEVPEEIHHPEDDPGVKKVLSVFPGKLIF